MKKSNISAEMGNQKMVSGVSSKNHNTRHNRVLVVIPTLGDRLELLRETLRSAKDQSPVIADVVIVCPKKSVAARKLAKEFGATVCDDPGSLSEAINVGFDLAKPWHEYVTEIGDDDLLRPGSIHATTSALDANPRAVLAYGYCDYIDTKGRIIFTSRAGRFAPLLISWGPNLLPLPGMVFRASAIKQVGHFDRNLKYSMDLDFLLRLRPFGEFINTAQVVAAFRWHPTSTTVANRRASIEEAQHVKSRYLPKTLQRIAPTWEVPVRIATLIAANRVNARALSLGREKNR